MSGERHRRRTLTARLVAAIVAVAAVVLGLSYATGYVLVRRELQQNALANLRSRTAELRPLVASLAVDSGLRGSGLLDGLAGLKTEFRAGLRITDMSAVLISPDGTVNNIGTRPVFSLPPSLQPSDLDPRQLLDGQDVSGRRANTVFLALPARTRPLRRQLLVVVATDRVETTVLSDALPLLLVAGLLMLLLAIVVAVVLARRLTRPIREIERAAAQLASGDLSARADVPPGTDGELAALGSTLNEMASQLERSRGTQRAFLLSISHDLRTPLTSIRGYAEALADGTLEDGEPDARKRAATVIGAEARRLERLVHDLLDLSRLDSREFSLTSRPCDLAEIVTDAADAFAPQAQALGLRLRSSSSAALPVALDPERLAQIVANLVENALKYAASSIDVSANMVDAGHNEIIVTDDGPGIRADDLGHVFDRLYTVRSTPGRSVGTGLGLAIVRELATAMGGVATVEAPPEGGTRFIVRLPSVTARVAAQASLS